MVFFHSRVTLSSSRNAVIFSSACTTKRFPLSWRCGQHCSLTSWIQTALSNSRNAVRISSARTTKRFPSSRCASAIQIVRPLESISETQPQLQPALLRFSVSNSARRSEADDFAIEPELQFLREAFEVNQLAVEPVHRQLTAPLLDAFAQFDDNLLSR